MSSFYLKTNRVFNPVKKYAWLFIAVVAFGGLWLPKLGLLMIPVMFTLFVLGLLKGKYWCGNLCPHGSLFDFLILPLSSNRKTPGFFKSKVLQGIAFLWFMFMLGSRLFKVFSLWGTVSFLDKLGYIFVMNYLVVTLVGTALALLFTPRTWCSFCPMGTFQGLAYRLGSLLGVNRKTAKKIVITAADQCISCGKCAQVCPMQLSPYLEFTEEGRLENRACISCSTCVEECPLKILDLAL
jgi:polyferredoxin